MNNKNRNCIICNSNQSILVDKEKLEVLGIGKIEIGVSICKKCGCVFQNPYVPKNIMRKFYEEFSNYTNAETGFKPSKERISNITEQIKFCLQNIQDKENAFQLGCSNGFTLSVLKSQGWNVKGIDPSPICKKLAKKNYGINMDTLIYFIF